METLILIPARKGSKSIPLKNLKSFCGRPLISWTIKLALESRLGRVCVTTDSEEIRDLAHSLGAMAPFLRPQALATDSIAIEPVLKHAFEFMSAREQTSIATLILLMPTAPFRVRSDLTEALQLFRSSPGCTSVISVREAIANENPHWMLKLDAHGRVMKFTNEPLTQMSARRQDLPKAYIRNDYVYVFRPENLFEEPSNLYGANPQLLISGHDRLDIDINTPRDWLIAETLFGDPKIFDGSGRSGALVSGKKGDRNE